MGDEFYERLNSEQTGMHPPQWLTALAETTGAALRASVAGGTGDWRQLWPLLCGLALTAPSGDTQSETAKLARAQFPDIKDPYMTAQAEADTAAKLLADRGLTFGIGHPADGWRAAGDPLIARDAYGSRFLVLAPFGYDEAAPETTARLLARCLETGPLSDMLEGSEPRELSWEYYRLRRRARILVGGTAGSAAAASSGGGDPGSVCEAFLSWYGARHEDVPRDTAKDAGTIIQEWGPGADLEERSRYACSPHRIEMTALLLRDGYFPGYANAALRLLPEWTQWCIEQSGLDGDFAARSRAAALAEAEALVDEEAHGPAVKQDELPFRRQE